MSRKINKNEPNYRPSRPRRRRPPRNIPAGDKENVYDDAEESISAKKLKVSSTDVIVNLSFCYRIIEFVSVFAAISDLAVCRKCKRDLSFGQSGDRGLGFKIVMRCKCSTTLIDSSPCILNAFDINRRLVFAMRLLGVGREGIKIFCGIMDLGHGLSRTAYANIVQHIYASSKKMFDICCKNATRRNETK